MPTQPLRTATSLALDFIIVGGGLAGLSAAYSLTKAGHHVRLLEKLPGLGSPAGGVRVPPNMSKILKKWVGAEELAKTAVLNVATPWYHLHTGEKMGAAPWRPDVMAETGGDFLVMKHEDAHRLIHRLAVAAGANIQFGATVTKVTPGDPKPSVTLSTGEVLTADIVIGADGSRSMIRALVLDREDDAEPTGVTVFGACIPGSAMEKDPELAQMLHAQEWPIMMGDSRSFCAHPVSAHKEFAIQLHWPDNEVGTPDDAVESWFESVPVSVIKTDGLSSLAKRLLKLVPHGRLYRTRYMLRSESIDEWFDESGRIVLMGEAAHPWFPSGTHASAMAVEDAVVFGTLFGHLSSWEQIPTFLNAYEEVRQNRTNLVREIDHSNGAFIRMPAGPASDKRNADFRLSRNDWDDGALKTEFESLASLFGYDAEDAANEWWVTWGRYTAEDYTGSSQVLDESEGNEKRSAFTDYAPVTSVRG